MTVGDDDRGERFPERLHAGAERPPIRDTECRVNDNDTGSGLDEIGVDWKETRLESVNGYLAFCTHDSELTIDRTWLKCQRSLESCQGGEMPSIDPIRVAIVAYEGVSLLDLSGPLEALTV